MRHALRITIALSIATVAIAPPFARAQQRAKADPRPATAPVFDSSTLAALEWRNIGPFRGGRVTAVAGIAAQPLAYYMGSTGGGVWKTDDAGLTWRNVTDGFVKTGSVGAIAVAESDPNVVYVGMGEAPVRGVASSSGDGVYRSTDGGRTWTHLGLEKTKQISRILVHPRNADLVYVAAQGSRWAPTDDRGVYRSTDGGKTWTRVLFVDRKAGPSDLAMDLTNPRMLYAAFWEHQRVPWQVRSGGPNSGLWKSTDGGDTWTRLTEGLPSGMGKIGVAVSPANPDRVWAIIEADEGGLYRSDDAGKTWRRVNESRDLRARAWYYTHIIADPRNADVVYVLNSPMYRSTDGGRSFTQVSVPHGDSHALWINPTNTADMIFGDDGGATISFNGGRSWSTQGNQPTAQFYRVNTDAQFPYRVYGGQQDNTSVSILSRTFGAGIERTDWDIRGGCESAWLAFDPKSPRFTYGGCYQGIIEEHDAQTGKTRNIQEWPALGLGEPSDLQKYRFNWSAPIVTSPHDGRVIYHGGNVLFRSNDRGQSWTAISGDLTRNDKTKQGLGGAPITNEGAGGEVYNTIYTVAESPVAAGTIWVGTDDGLVQLTRDGGRTWTNVTPKNGPGEALVYVVEPSPHEAGTAYVAITRYKWDDDAPYLFRTSDFGQTWTKITTGIKDNDLVRVVREDPVRRGLLYAGTEHGVYFSLDAGASWRSLQRNLPIVPVTDLQVHDGDLVASTEGRAFWILDDITPLRELADSLLTRAAYLYTPRDAYRLDWANPQLPGIGRNPPPGAIIRYQLAQKHDSTSEVKLEIADATGAVLRTFRNVKRAGPDSAAPLLPAKAGMNAFAWDLRVESATRVPGLFMVGSVEGYRVSPGTYEARLTLDGQRLTRTFKVFQDPRSAIADADERAHDQLLRTIHGRVSEMLQSVIDTRNIRDQVNGVVSRTKDHPDAKAIGDAGKSITSRVDSIETKLVQPRIKTFQDVINFRNGLADQYLYLEGSIDGTEPPLTKGMTDRFGELEQQWAPIRDSIQRLIDEVNAFNALLRQKNIEPVILPAKPKVVSLAR